MRKRPLVVGWGFTSIEPDSSIEPENLLYSVHNDPNDKWATDSFRLYKRNI